MNRALLLITVILASIALIGLITIQLYWTQNLFKLKEEQFQQNVQTALTNVAKQLEYKETLSAISLDVASSKNKNQQLFIKSENGEIRFNYKAFSDSTGLFLYDEDNEYIIRNSSIIFEDSAGLTDYEISVKSKNILPSLSNRNEADDYIIPKENLSTSYTANKKINKILSRIDFIEDIVNKLLNLSKPIKQRVNSVNLDSLIQINLKEQGITAAYNFEIYVLNKGMYLPDDKIGWAFKNEKKPANEVLNANYVQKLFPNDLAPNSSYLLLAFPSQSSYLLANMSKILLSSSIFIILIIICFTYSISTILKQKKLSDVKTDFINNMTHELKTPISTIRLATEVLSEPNVVLEENKAKRYIKIIDEENKRLNEQVQKVLQIAQLDKGDFKLKKDLVDIHFIINKSVDHLKLQIEKRAGDLNLQLNAIKSIVEGDDVHLTNIIYDVLDNANKYSPDSPQILLKTENLSDNIIITIQDEGIGMDKKTQKRIFEKFYRLPTGDIHNVKGFGLGLSYVYKIVAMHNGKIEVISALGEGTMLKIILPLKLSA